MFDRAVKPEIKGSVRGVQASGRFGQHGNHAAQLFLAVRETGCHLFPLVSQTVGERAM